MTDPGPTMSWAQASLRFALELIAWGAAAWWGASLFEGTLASVVGGVIAGGISMGVWVVFNVPGDPSRSGEAPVAVPGWVRILLEGIVFGAGVGALVALGRSAVAAVFAALVVFHIVAYRERLRWLLDR